MKNRKPFTLNGRHFSFEVIPHNNQGRQSQYWVRDAAGNHIGLLNRQGLKRLAWCKYTFALSLDFEIAATKFPYDATARRMIVGALPEKGSVLEVPIGNWRPTAQQAQISAFSSTRDADKDRAARWEDMKAKTKPRKIPHVRMVRAAALQPGMRVVLFVLKGRVEEMIQVHDIAFSAQHVSVKGTHMARRPDDGSHIAWGCDPRSFFWNADEVLPVFIEWRNKVAL